MTDLNLSGIRRLAKKGGAERISREALEYLLYVTERIVIAIAKASNENARARNKVTVEKSDVISALSDILKNPNKILKKET